MRITIRTRILFLFIGIVLIQGLLLCAFFLNQHSKSLRNEVDNRLKTVTARINTQIINYLERSTHSQQPLRQKARRMPLDWEQQYNLVTSFENTKLSSPIHLSNEERDTVNYERLQEIVDQTICPSGQNIFILNSRGKVLAKKIQSRSEPHSFPVDRVRNGEVLIDKTFFITASSSLYVNGQKFIIVATMNKQTALAPALKIFQLLTFLVFLLFLISLLIGWTTFKHIIPPLQRLAGSSATLRQGKDIDISLQGDAELQDLAQAMNSMNKELQTSNMSLEQEILLRRREEKKAIQARIDAEKTSQAKSIFLANMSHEIRTPLHAMIGLLNMLDNSPLSNEQKKLLTMASVSGKRLQTIVNSILDLSRIESGKFQLHHSIFPLSALITEVTELMQIHANEKHLELTASQDSDIPDILQGDSGRIRQILINLLNNSIKYTDQGGIHLTIHLQSIPNDQEVELLFCIKDSGRGISAESRETIFDPFDQGEIKADKVTEGVGLGLAISNEYVHHMQGRIWLEKSDEHGSMFCFTIRCEKAEEPIPESEEEPKKAKKKLATIHILLADDEFINQRIVSAYLEELGATVSICENGQELLEKMDQESADIILMDICMPILDGLEATKIIREKEANGNLPRVPIIALTAQATTDLKAKCKAAGMDDYVTKPIPFNDLTRIICELHENAGTHRSTPLT
ncbi:MAG: response regulator [Proteobacteria bacterium]|nr:response regulator [Pseudomonadota bacterium]